MFSGTLAVIYLLLREMDVVLERMTLLSSLCQSQRFFCCPQVLLGMIEAILTRRGRVLARFALSLLENRASLGFVLFRIDHGALSHSCALFSICKADDEHGSGPTAAHIGLLVPERACLPCKPRMSEL